MSRGFMIEYMYHITRDMKKRARVHGLLCRTWASQYDSESPAAAVQPLPHGLRESVVDQTGHQSPLGEPGEEAKRSEI
jgi:hypothetical protein